MFAGHLILVSFGALCVALFDATKIGAILPGALLVALTGFELLVAFLQATNHHHNPEKQGATQCYCSSSPP
jgi:hypothetical protein